MLKSVLQILVVVSTSIVLFGCNNKKSDDSSGAAVSTQCFNDPYNGGCNNAYYNNYGAYGYSAYPYGYSSDPNSIYRYQVNSYYGGWGGSSLCSCPSGTRPVYNGNMGTGCVAQSALPRYAPVYYWSWSAQSTYNDHYVNWGQMSNITNTWSNSGCYNNVAWSCMVGQANQCPGGTACTATAQNSPIGVCVRQ